MVCQVVFDNEKMNAKMESHLEKNGKLLCLTVNTKYLFLTVHQNIITIIDTPLCTSFVLGMIVNP